MLLQYRCQQSPCIEEKMSFRKKENRRRRSKVRRVESQEGSKMTIDTDNKEANLEANLLEGQEKTLNTIRDPDVITEESQEKIKNLKLHLFIRSTCMEIGDDPLKKFM